MFLSSLYKPVFRTADGVAVTMTPAEFAERFGAIRAHFNWQRFTQHRWPIRVYTLEDRETLRKVNTAMRMRFGRQPKILKPFGGHFMRVGEQVDIFSKLNDQHRAAIEEFIDAFSKKDHVELDLPAYRLPRNQQMLLDGNHRLTALAMVDVPFRVRLYSVTGPWLYIPR